MNIITIQAIYRGAFGLGVAVILGAMGAHYLEDKLEPKDLQIFETAVKYQFYGCFGLFIMGILNHLGTPVLKLPIICLRFGILIFCGTLYFLALRPLFEIKGLNWIGAITPIGGLAMIAAWLWTGFLYFKDSKNALT